MVGAHRRSSSSSNNLSSRGSTTSATGESRHGSAGHSSVKVQKALGHSDLKTTMSYYTIVRSDLESLVEPQETEKQEVAGSKG